MKSTFFLLNTILIARCFQIYLPETFSDSYISQSKEAAESYISQSKEAAS